jgi:hypothetical protein
VTRSRHPPLGGDFQHDRGAYQHRDGALDRLSVRKHQKKPRRLMINFAQRRIGRRRSIFQCSDGDALQRVYAMRRQVSKLCCDYDRDSIRGPIPATLVTAERFSASIAFLMHLPEDNLASGLSERDEHLLAAYRRVFGGRLNRREANRLLGCLGWVQF